MTTSRQRLIEYLASKRTATAIEIAHALHMTRVNARHHLAILETEGVVQVIGKRGETRGRPQNIYSLTQPMLSNNLPELCRALLSELLEGKTQTEQMLLLEKIASRLSKTEEAVPRSMTQRINHAIRFLNQHNYQARWEAHADSPRIVLDHCPYWSILPEHPEICTFDATLIKMAVSAPMKQVAKLQPTPLGLRQCVFRLE